MINKIIRDILLKTGKVIYPDVTDEEKLIEEMMRFVDLKPATTYTKSTLKRKCPSCNAEYSYQLFDISAEEQKKEESFKSEWRCLKCGFSTKSKRRITEWLNELGIDYRMQTKASLGVRMPRSIEGHTEK
ncbi:MAG: hypothetical protein ABSB32_21450 [Thermodesulfobacteriota bacterium]